MDTQTEFSTINTKEVVTVVAFIAGVNDDILKEYYGPMCSDLIQSLENQKDACILRYLSKIRTTMMANFKDTNDQIVYSLKNIDQLPELYNAGEIRKLTNWGVNILMTNTKADKYLEHISVLINQQIDRCRSLFHSWIHFEYIRELFFTPKENNKQVFANDVKQESVKFARNRKIYPFQVYIRWNPKDVGNLLSSDYKFLKYVYAIHGDYIYDTSKLHDAKDTVKNGIYDFVENSEKTAIVVDCENSDAFKLYGMLKNLDEEKLAKIQKIMLYDDVHTSTAWDWLGKFTRIPVEHMEVKRVSQTKSLVDISMTAGVCSEFYKNCVDSFILCSSDSDFWGLISSLPDANFLVLYERIKCGHAIKEAMEEHAIPNCSMDDFYTGNADDLKKQVLLDILKSYFPNLIGMNGMELARKVYEDSKIKFRQSDVEWFYTYYIKPLRLSIDKEGNFVISLP